MGLLLKLSVWIPLPPPLRWTCEHVSQRQPFHFISPKALVSQFLLNLLKTGVKESDLRLSGPAARWCSGCGRDEENCAACKPKCIEMINECIWRSEAVTATVTRFGSVIHQFGTKEAFICLCQHLWPHSFTSPASCYYWLITADDRNCETQVRGVRQMSLLILGDKPSLI